MKRRRNRWVIPYTYRAECQDCDFLQDGRNALALAALHHDRLDHTVMTDVYGGVTYYSDAEQVKQLANRAAR